MDVKTVCLGMLTDGPASGYDMKKHFESSFGYFFAAGYGSIYPALASLAKEGLVECEEIPQEGKPDRKVYRITEPGRQHLLKELDNPCPSHKVRSEFLATIWFAQLMSPDQVQTILDNRLQETKRYLELFNEFENTCMEEWTPGARFVLGFGKAIMQTVEQYIEDTGHTLFEEADTKKLSASG